jgi:SAM-dependent methyltransferase
MTTTLDLETAEPAADPPRVPVGRETMSVALPEAERYHEWVYNSFKDQLRGRILEIGVGLGIYTAKLLRHGPVIATDLDAECLDAVRERFFGNRLTCMQLDLEKSRDFAPFAKRQCDTIVCLNVLEHVPDDAGAIRNLAGALKAGGKLILYVPAMPCLFGTMDEAAGHVRRYTRGALATMLEDAGFSIVRCRYQNALGAIGWALNGRVFKQRDLSSDSVSAQIRLFDRIGVPLTRAVDHFTRSFAGQSLLIVGRKT